MNLSKFTRYSLMSITVVVVLAMMMSLAFAGGMLLGPYMTGNALAEASIDSPVASPEARQFATDETDFMAAYEQALIDIYQASLPTVVNIRVTQKIDAPVGNDPFNFGAPFGPYGFSYPGPLPQTPEEFYNQGQGSGFVWDNEGHIVTNNHVVEGASDVEVIFADGTTVKADVLGTDPDSDLAVIKVDVPDELLQPAPLGDSDALQTGQLAIAIGNPFGQEFTMTSGIISAVGRTIRSGNTPFSIPEVIQTDAPINPGNSGGPLLNRHGEVIGINTQIISRSGTNAGIGFAVPINIARQVIPILIQGESFQYAWLGITGTTLTSEVTDFMNLPKNAKGALVINVAQDSPADEAGLRGSDKTLKVAGSEYQLGGDVIIAINDQPVEDMDDLIAYMVEETHPGDTVTLTVIRPNGEQETVEVTLGVRPGIGTINQQNK